ncbi:MAG: Gfo/Idh/MocA family oxidoreductase [Chitinophagales bacterium]|nr:Gfo/Idh/MocA family oxidoreductase [Chitinophagales bacterium]
MKDIKFAIVGCGRIAQRHAEQIHIYGELIAVCDIEKGKANELAEKYAAKAYYNIDDMLLNEKSVDVVAVCTPNGLHAEHGIKILKAGFHALVEKPLALSVADCEVMMKTAEENSKQLFTIMQNRFNPPVAALKKAIEDNVLGNIYSVHVSCYWNRNESYYANSWKGTKDLDGGTLFTQFSHFVDLLYWLIGDVKKAYAITENFAHKGNIEFEDTGVVALQFLNGSIGTINYTVNSYNKNMEGSITLFAEKGTVKIGGQYLNEIEYQCIEGFKFENLPEGNGPNNYGTYVGSMSNHDKVYENLINVLLHGDKAFINAYEAMKTVEIINKIYQSAKQNYN